MTKTASKNNILLPKINIFVNIKNGIMKIIFFKDYRLKSGIAIWILDLMTSGSTPWEEGWPGATHTCLTNLTMSLGTYHFLIPFL
jgi:hypothetical protein